MTQFQKHHIVPKYKCKELGIDPEFEDNYCYPIRYQHALIHWGYKCKDLKPLLEVCNPPQYVIDMIPLGDNRDVGAAVLLAEGEIEQIDNSGENNPMWKGGITVGDNLKEYMKAYRQKPEVKEYEKAYQKAYKQTLKYKAYQKAYMKEYMKAYIQKPEVKEYKKAYNQTPKYKAYQKAYQQTPEYKTRRKEYNKAYYAKKKQQGQGTLEQFL